MPNPTLPVTEVSALKAPAGLAAIEMRSPIQFVSAPLLATFKSYLGIPGEGGGPILIADLSDATAFGQSLLALADAAAARSTLGAAPTSHTHAIADVTSLQAALDARQPLATNLTTWAGIAPASGVETFLATPNAANLAALVTTTGSGSFVLASGATIASPTISGLMTVGSGAAVGLGAGSTLTISGTLTGTPSGGTLNLSAVTVTLPASFLTATNTVTVTNKSISGATNTITNVSLTTGVTGQLPVANGGTAATTAAGARTNLDVPAVGMLGGLWDLKGKQNINYRSKRYITPVVTDSFSREGQMQGGACFQMFFFNESITFESASIYHTQGTHASHTMGFALYNADPVTRLPTTRIANSDVAFSLASPGVKTANFAADVVVPAGLVWGFLCVSTSDMGIVNPYIICAPPASLIPQQSLWGYSNTVPAQYWGTSGLAIHQWQSPPTSPPSTFVGTTIEHSGQHRDGYASFGVACIVLKEK